MDGWVVASAAQTRDWVHVAVMSCSSTEICQCHPNRERERERELSNYMQDRNTAVIVFWSGSCEREVRE